MLKRLFGGERYRKLSEESKVDAQNLDLILDELEKDIKYNKDNDDLAGPTHDREVVENFGRGALESYFSLVKQFETDSSIADTIVRISKRILNLSSDSPWVVHEAIGYGENNASLINTIESVLSQTGKMDSTSSKLIDKVRHSIEHLIGDSPRRQE